MLPFRFGTTREFAAARDVLLRADYTAPGICARAGIDGVDQFDTIGEGRQDGLEIRDRLDLLIRLFLDAVAVRSAQVDEHLPAADLEALLALGLIDRHPQAPDRYAATVRLYPVGSLHIVSDLEALAPGVAAREELGRADHVFSAITTLTSTFVSQIPQSPCERFLELCAGTGVAALRAAATAGRSWSLDITERSTRFAEFNAQLNGITNCVALQGDLYEPVAGLTFDRIVAHPPYVPAPDTHLIYRDGGNDGESITRRILADLPDYLEPGGRFYCTLNTTDRKGATLEERFRQMLGERQGEFDLLAVVHHAMPPAEFYGRLAASGRISYAQAEERHNLFRSLDAERVVYCSVILQRHTVQREAFTIRRERAEGSSSDETEWLLGWSTRLAEADVLAGLVDTRPVLSPHAVLHMSHSVEAGQWKVSGCEIRLRYPFVRTVEISPNGSMLLSLFDGTLTVREIMERMRSAGALPVEVPESAFAEFVRELIGEGVLRLDEAALTLLDETYPTPILP
jgi:methylase of polypeptide subunit release factors